MTNPNDPVKQPVWFCEGLSKREYFAAMAMQGLLAHPLKVDAVPAEPMIAAMARLMADTLIAELNK